MDDYENIVMSYLAAQGFFLSPQYSILSDGHEWNCADFVGLDFSNKEINIIEVSGAYNLSGLVKKVNNREWITKLKTQLKQKNIADSLDKSWRYVIRVFIRKDREAYFKENVDNKDGSVKIEILENIPYPWSENYYRKFR